MSEEFDLSNKVAVVFGGGQTPGASVGNGRAASEAYAHAGATVIVIDRHLASAEDTVNSMVASTAPLGHCAYECDITNDNRIREVVTDIINKTGRIDILHNNIGISVEGGDSPIDTITRDIFRRIFEVNLLGMAMTCQEVLPHMIKQKGGVITNIGSIASHSVYPYLAYKVTKLGVVGLTQHIATRYASVGIRCNTILPGLMNTPMAIEARVKRGDDSREAIVEGRNKKVPLRGGMGSGRDIGNASLFLASAKFITGISLTVDGGTSAFVGSYAEPVSL